jgi:alkanesulfonate monooxygenase SsuD/methylene tetrahydromethanopterin reductase-like flavin-dependent oxidoreductase (luciferase family)
MRYGIVTANLGDYADPRVVVRLARAAEAAGWETFFVWNHLGFVRGVPSGDPCVVILSAVATSTTHLNLGRAVTPLARRRPQVVANALASLDLLSAGRVILEVGLGSVPEAFTAFGESGDAKQCAAMLDEGLTILDGLWSGETVTHRGQHYAVEGCLWRRAHFSALASRSGSVVRACPPCAALTAALTGIAVMRYLRRADSI